MRKIISAALLLSTLVIAALGDSCSVSPYPQLVEANELLSFTITPPEFQECQSRSVSVTSPPTAGTLTNVGEGLIYKAPSYETDDVASVTIKCISTGKSCELLIGFLVSAPLTTPTQTTGMTLNPSVTSGPVTAATTTASTETLPKCPTAALNFSVALSSVLNSALPVSMPNCAGITTYRAAASNTKGRVYVNLVGSLLIVGDQFETLEVFNIVASCDSVQVCNIPITVISYKTLTAPPTTSAAAAQTECPSVYYYESPIGSVFSSSLMGMPNQPACAFGRAFTLYSGPTAGVLNLYLNGDFTYEPPSSEGWATFSFNHHCMGVITCVGTARMLVTNKVTVIPASTSAGGPNTTPFISDGYTTCQGTCNEKAWKVLTGTSLVWDTAPNAVGNVTTARTDKQIIGAVGVDFFNGSVVISGYSQIGSLSARFLTFDPVTNFQSPSGAPLASFKSQCLANQPQVGLSEEVWKWVSLANKTGYVGIRYNSGSSYYHKFGGKHIGCDTFSSNPCTYAPLLTPNTANWKVDINNCDVTWKGTYTIAALTSLLTAGGDKVFYYTSSKDVKGTIYSQGVTAKSWLDPSLGAISNTVPHTISMTFDTAVTAAKADANAPYSLDAQYFEYTDSNGDKAFGINLLFYSSTTSEHNFFITDRHVKGFRFLRSEWTSVTASTCPTCTGSKTVCTNPTSAIESAFTGEFLQGTCEGDLAFVTLEKGMGMSDAECAGHTVSNQVRNRPGFSTPRNCSNAFQNLTIRGIAAGSRSVTTPLGFEGTISLQLLLDNGNRPIVNLDVKSYVTRVAVDEGLKGSLSVCRSSPYWPVYDPLGTSLPDKPHRLYSGEPGLMCIDQHDLKYGPTGWAVFSLDVPDIDPKSLIIDSISVQLPSEEPIYLMYRNQTTGLLTDEPHNMSFWTRTSPFLNFRFINNASILSHSHDITLSSTTAFGFAITPGTLYVDSSLTVKVVVRSMIKNSDGSLTSGAATFRRIIYLDPLLTTLTRFGPTAAVVSEEHEHHETKSLTSIFVVICIVTAILVFVGLFLLSASTERQFPSWMPRATFLHNIPVLGVIWAPRSDEEPNYDNPYQAAMGARFNLKPSFDAGATYQKE